MDDVYENINDYNPIRKEKKLIALDDMIADIMDNKKFQTIIKSLFIRCKEIKLFTCFYHRALFFCSKRLNTTHYFILKINNRIELKNIATDHSADIDY